MIWNNYYPSFCSCENVSTWKVDQLDSLLIAPEGELAPSGKLLRFKGGGGFIAVLMRVPIVPIKIAPSYLKIFPPMDGRFVENIPKERKRIWIKIGRPFIFPKGTSYEEVTKKIQQALEAL